VRPARDAFIESFIRPNGRDRPSNEVLVEAIERLAGGPRPEPDALPLRHLPLRGLLLVAGRMAESRRIGLDPDLTRDRLGARTLRLAATTERLRPLSPRLALAVSAVAEAHERRAAARVALLVRRRDDERKRRKARSREEKRRGLELLGDRRLEVDLRP
jgi:hypothetical protein